MAIKISGTTVIDDNRNIQNVGVITATTFSGAVSGNATGLTGTPDITVRNITGVAATFTGVVTYEDVTNVDALGISTFRNGVVISGGGLNVTAGVSTLGSVKVSSGIVTAATGIVTYYGDGQYLTGVAAAGSGGSNDITSNLFF